MCSLQINCLAPHFVFTDLTPLRLKKKKNKQLFFGICDIKMSEKWCLNQEVIMY